MNQDVGIMGLKASSHGRLCESHSCFGELVSADDLIWFKYWVVDINGALEDSVKVCRIRVWTGSCMIGFLSRHVMMNNKGRYIGKFAQIVEIYEDFENRTKRFKNRQNSGLAVFSLWEDIP